MKKVIDFVFLKKEAYLFDAKLYILKTLVSVSVAYMVVRNLPLVQKDMISVLFGLMMTLEPVTVTGIRSGLRQITATVLGALATAIIITAFGNNVLTVALSVSATLFLCLKINWREVSPVAIFTSIYMSQYVQHSINGEPSVILTFQLRIMALGIGILIAVLSNFVFSLFFYKRMEKKRIVYLLVSISNHIKQIKNAMEEVSMEKLCNEKELLQGTFGGIDWLSSLVKDKEKEATFKRKVRLNSHYEEIISFQKVLLSLRSINHLIYDVTYVLEQELFQLNGNDKIIIFYRFDKLTKECDYLASHYENDFVKYERQDDAEEVSKNKDNRLMDNLNRIQVILDEINGSRSI